MRWPRKKAAKSMERYQYESKWHLRFAWYPTRFNNRRADGDEGWVWLEYYWRRNMDVYYGAWQIWPRYYQYRYINNPPEGLNEKS